MKHIRTRNAIYLCSFLIVCAVAPDKTKSFPAIILGIMALGCSVIELLIFIDWIKNRKNKDHDTTN